MSDAIGVDIGSAGGPSPALVKALIRMLRPLVRLLLANRVTYPVLSNILKAVYVDVADRDFPVPGKSQTNSRISHVSTAQVYRSLRKGHAEYL